MSPGVLNTAAPVNKASGLSFFSCIYLISYIYKVTFSIDSFFTTRKKELEVRFCFATR
jgi:hypothetical protein